MSKYVSLGRDAIYGDFEWSDPKILRDAIGQVAPKSAKLLAKLSEVRSYKMLPPAAIGANDPKGISEALKQNHKLSQGDNETTTSNFDVYLAQLNNVFLHGRRVYLVDEGYQQLFELNRIVDRPNFLPTLAAADLPTEVGEYITTQHPTLLLVSAGSYNWGHFLVDELPGVMAYVNKFKPTVLSVAMTSWPQLNERFDFDAKRVEALQILFPDTKLEVTFLDETQNYFYKSLLWVTPVTMHPSVKPQDLLVQMRNRFFASHPVQKADLKLLVLRTGNRNLTGSRQAQLVEYFEALGYLAIYPDKLSVLEQFRLFSQASHIVGVYGAALTSSIFCPAGSKLLTIMPINRNEKADSFYLDISGLIGQEHFIYYFCRPRFFRGKKDAIRLDVSGFEKFVETSGFLD